MGEVDLGARVRCLADCVKAFAASHGVRAELQPWAPMGVVTGVELTDFYAEQPGAGQGSLVMRHFLELAQTLGVAVYLRPSGSRAREFYARAGFTSVNRRGAGGAHGFVAWYPCCVDEDEDEREASSARFERCSNGTSA